MKIKRKKGMTKDSQLVHVIESLDEFICDNVKAFENSLKDYEWKLFIRLTPGQREYFRMFNVTICEMVREMMMAVAEKKIIFEIDKKKKIEGTK